MTPYKRAAETSVEPVPVGEEQILFEDFINSLDRSSDAKVMLCRITAQYARNRWPLPSKLNNWIAEVMVAAAEGRKPFPRPRGKRAPYLDMAVFIKKLEKKGAPLDVAKKRAEQKFGVSRQTINSVLRKYEISPDILDSL